MDTSIVDVNVGGKLYTTFWTTLTPIRELVFASPRIGNGAYFIDRNGELFESVLDYLREPIKWSPPRDKHLCYALETEASYYHLDGMVEKCHNASIGCVAPTLVFAITHFPRSGTVYGESAENTLPLSVSSHIENAKHNYSLLLFVDLLSIILKEKWVLVTTICETDPYTRNTYVFMHN